MAEIKDIRNIREGDLPDGERNLIIMTSAEGLVGDTKRIVDYLSVHPEVENIYFLPTVKHKNARDRIHFENKKHDLINSAFVNNHNTSVLYIAVNGSNRYKHDQVLHGEIVKDMQHLISLHPTMMGKLTVHMQSNFKHKQNFELEVNKHKKILGFHSNLHNTVSDVVQTMRLPHTEYEKKVKNHYSPPFHSLHRHNDGEYAHNSGAI